MNLFESFVYRAFPNATVHRLPHRDAYRVSIEVEGRQLMADREAAWRRVAQGLRPKFPPRRRLHWGNAHPRRGMLRLVLRTGSFGRGSPSGTLAAP